MEVINSPFQTFTWLDLERYSEQLRSWFEEGISRSKDLEFTGVEDWVEFPAENDNQECEEEDEIEEERERKERKQGRRGISFLRHIHIHGSADCRIHLLHPDGSREASYNYDQ